MKNTKEILVDLIKIDTQNFKQNETDVVNYIIDFCNERNIKYETYSKILSRKNIVISIGKKTEEDIIVLGHTDVVTAKEEDGWDCHPFSGEEKDGYIYGRGTLDMKYLIASSLSIMDKLKKIESSLQKAVHFVFTVDEENGSEYGMKFLLQNEKIKKLLTNKIVINEGGGFSLTYNNNLYYLYETGQKSVGRLKLLVKENKNTNPYFPNFTHEQVLVKAVKNIESIDLSTALPKTTTNLLKNLVGKNIKDENLIKVLKENSNSGIVSLIRSMSESYITATLIKGGSRNKNLHANYKAEVIFDIRLLPNIKKDTLMKHIENAVENLPVEVELLSFSKGFESDINNNIVKIFESCLKEKNENIKSLLPFITPGANDGKYLKDLGCLVFGFAPLCEKDSFVEILKGIHSVNEKILVESIDFNKEVLEKVIIKYLGGEFIA